MNLLEKSLKIKVNRGLVAVFLLLAASACETPPIPASQVPDVPGLAEPDELALRHGLEGAETGFLLVDAVDGRTVAERESGATFIPASTVKVLTAYAALSILGPDHRFSTGLHRTGRIRGGTLEGDLYLVGGGDPLLGVDGLLDLVLALKAAGVARIKGRFFFDDNALPDLEAIEQTQPETAAYNPGLSGLMVDFNRRRLTWRPAAGGGTEAFLTPDLGRRGVKAELIADGAPAGETWLPVRRSGLHAAHLFAALAEMNGIEVPAPKSGSAPPDAQTIARHEGAPLADVARSNLEFSNNLVSEALGLAVSNRLSGRRAGTLAASAGILGGWLRTRVPGVSWKGLALPNHSGLSADARVSAAQMVAVLRQAREGQSGPPFQTLLPAAGIRDAFAGRFREPDAALRIWAKTGTLHYATGLAGYLHTRSGRTLVFALYVTDFAGRAAYDALGDPEDPSVLAAAKAWRDRAKAFEADLVRGWIERF